MGLQHALRSEREHPQIARADGQLLLPARESRVQRLGASERLFVELHRFTATNVTRVIALEGTLDPLRLEGALAALAARHPLMRARISTGFAPSFVHDAAPPLQLYVVRRRDGEHWRELLEELLNRPLDHAAGRLFEVHYLYAARERRAELILVGEHAACDGVSMNSLCAELLALCAGAPRLPVRPTLPVLEALLPSFSWPRRLTSLGGSLARLTRVSVERRLREPRTAGRTSAYAFTRLSRERTAHLVARARLAGATVTGVLMAAALLAVRTVRRATPRLALSVPVNLRARLPARAVQPEDLGNYTGAVFLEAQTSDGLWELARALKADLDRAASGDALLAAAPLAYRAAAWLVRAEKPPLAHAMLSNSGVVPLQSDYGAFRPLGFFSASSAPMVSADFCVFCNTLDSRLCVNLVYAKEIVTRDEAEGVLTRIRDLLRYA